MSCSEKTIAHIIYHLGVGGLENGLVNIINGLPRESSRHVIICLAGYDSFRDRIQRDDVKLIDIEKQPGKDPKFYIRLFRVLRSIRPDVVHTRNIAALDCQIVAAVLRIPLRIHSEHGWVVEDLQGSRRSHRLLRRVSRLFVHRYMVVSRDMIEWLRNVIGISVSKTFQIYNGIDCERFFPAPKGGSVSLQHVGIITVGRLDPIKNQRLLIEAFSRMRERLRDETVSSHLTVVGDGPLRNELMEQVNALGLSDAVTFMGAIEDVSVVLRNNQVFALPSLNEGISNTILEAMASGLPVIATRVGGNPELVVDGETGTLFESGDANGLCNALIDYVMDSKTSHRHGKQARRRAMNKFSMATMLENYSRLYGLCRVVESIKEN